MSQPDNLPEKPTRTFSKRMTGACIAACWATIWLSMWLGVGMATIVVPVMIAAMLGLSSAYQAVGHFDLRALAATLPSANAAPPNTALTVELMSPKLPAPKK
jgi:hypothetical protein